MKLFVFSKLFLKSKLTFLYNVSLRHRGGSCQHVLGFGNPFSLKIAHINACSLLPKIDLIELEMSNNDIILVSETHLSQIKEISNFCFTIFYSILFIIFDGRPFVVSVHERTSHWCLK
jgi:hypothetical protein